MSGGSVSFDRAAGYYDQTRSLSPATVAVLTELLTRELADRSRCLEVGVGTGRIALPLLEAGVEIFGLDIARSMLSRLIEKAGGRPPFPLVVADATALPFADDAFGAGLVSHVLHLVPEWHRVLAELVRVTGPGGVVLANHGGYAPGPWREMQDRFAQAAGSTLRPVGLDWGDLEGLDRAMVSLGVKVRELPPLTERIREPPARFLVGIEANRYSWTWGVDDAVRARAAANVRAWAERRFGDLERRLEWDQPIVWRAYDLR